MATIRKSNKKLDAGNDLVREAQSKSPKPYTPLPEVKSINQKINGSSINSILGTGIKSVSDSINEVSNITTGPLNKLWRTAILLNRQTSTLPKDTTNETRLLIKKKSPDEPNPVTTSRESSTKPKVEIERNITENKPLSKLKTPIRSNDIIIINTNVSPAQSIVIQNRPSELMVNPGTTWSSVKSFGRNNSFQIYTGSEDTITFKVSWYSKQGSREDVIAKCRLLESWSKANGYLSAPPILNLLWGDSGLFDDHYFILTDASYTLSNFQDSVMVNDEVVNLKLLPNTAVQTITLKRVDLKNLTHSDIILPEKLKSINGIK